MEEKELFFLVYLEGYIRGNPMSALFPTASIEADARKDFEDFWVKAAERGLDKVVMTRG